jgi:Zn-dependent protease
MGDVQGQVRPSPAFVVVLAATGLGAWLCVSDLIDGGIAVFVFVFSGWILSLIFHEFAHAYIAWKGGDRSIPAKGYLTLDPRRYADPVTSIVLPLAFLLIGGIGLPGGAVWINRAALRSRATATAVSLAGPFTNLVFAAVCLLPLSMGMVDESDQPVLVPALAFLGFLQVVAFVLNMLPVPGLDGFGALEPHLPRSILTTIAPFRQWGMLVLFLAIFYVPAVRDAFWDTTGILLDSLGVKWELVSRGWGLFRFWT